MSEDTSVSRRDFFKFAGTSALAATGMSVAAATPAHAWSNEAIAEHGFSEDFALTWDQMGDGAPWNALPGYDGGLSCYVMAVLYLARKCGGRGAGYGPVACHQENDQLGGALYEPGGMNVTFAMMTTLGDGKAGERVGQRSASVADIAAAYEANNLVCVNVAVPGRSLHHYVAVDYVKDGKVYIFDSSYSPVNGGKDIEIDYASFEIVTWAYQGEGHVRDLPTLETGFEGADGKGAGAKEGGANERVVDENGIPEEWQLVGMRDRKLEVIDTQAKIERITPLDAAQMKGVQQISDRMHAEHEGPNPFRVGLSVLSYAVMMWATLMGFAYLLDRSAGVTGNRALQLVSFGTLKTSPDKESIGTKLGRTRLVGPWGIALRLVGILILGILVVSGTVYAWIGGALG